jgi:hypothetical protein
VSILATVSLNALQRERAFYFAMAVALAMTAVLGFGAFFLMGHSNFGEPWFVHVHAVTMMTWMGLYLVQNAFAFRGNVARHRMLGVFAGAWSAWVVVVGLAITAANLAFHRIPPAFQDPAFFLAMDWSTIVLFAGLSWTALALRHRSDWHKRLMLGGTVNLVGPAWGRVLPLPLTGQNGVLLILVVLLGYLGVAMAFDRRLHGRIHPALHWSAGLLVASFAVVYPLSAWPAFRSLAAALGAY